MSFKSTDDWREAITWMVLPAGRAWQRSAGAAFEQMGLSLSAAAPLLVIARLGDGVRQKDIAEEAGIDPAAIARSVTQLERDGLLLRQTDAGDARAKILHLTPSGRALVAKLNDAIDEVRKDILSKVTDEEGRAAVRVLLALSRERNEGQDDV